MLCQPHGPQWLWEMVFEGPARLVAYFAYVLCQGTSCLFLCTYLFTLTNALPLTKIVSTIICFLLPVADWWKQLHFKLLLCVSLMVTSAVTGALTLGVRKQFLLHAFSAQSFSSAGRKQITYIIWSNFVIYPLGTDLQSSELCLKPLNGFLTAAVGRRETYSCIHLLKNKLL